MRHTVGGFRPENVSEAKSFRVSFSNSMGAFSASGSFAGCQPPSARVRLSGAYLCAVQTSSDWRVVVQEVMPAAGGLALLPNWGEGEAGNQIAR